MQRWIVPGLILLTLISYGHVLGNGFVDLDDLVYVSGNPHVLGGLTLDNIYWAWTTMTGGFYFPLAWMSLQLDAQLFAGQPWGFHLTSLLLHTANVVLLFWVLRWMTHTAWPSAMVAALFAVHPMHVENVAWACERKDVLASFFWLLLLAAYCWYARRTSLGRYILVLLTFVGGLLSKPMIVTAPLLLLLLDFWPLRRLRAAPSPPAALPRAERRDDLVLGKQLAGLFAEKIPLLMLSLLASHVTAMAQHLAGAFVGERDIPLLVRLSTALVGYCWYLKTTFVPVGLAFYYPHPYGEAAPTTLIACAATLAASTLIVTWYGRRVPALVVGWLWFIGVLFPVIGLFQVGLQGWADRFAYFPHIGLFIAIVWGATALRQRLHVPNWLVRAVATSVLAALAALTWLQVGKWRDAETMWLQTTAVTTNNHRAHSMLGLAYARNGKIELAIAELEKAAALGDLARYHSDLAQLYRDVGEADKARCHTEMVQKVRLREAEAAPRTRDPLMDTLKYALNALLAVLLVVPPIVSLWQIARQHGKFEIRNSKSETNSKTEISNL